MKTYFSKTEQKWVSKIPIAYWLGVCDEATGEKIYSDESLYHDFGSGKFFEYPFPIKNAQEYYKKYKSTPGVCLKVHYRKSNEDPKWKFEEKMEILF